MQRWFPAETRAVLLYDGQCGICLRSVRFLKARKGAERLNAVPLQTPGVLDDFGIAEADALSALHVIDRRGRISVGAEGVFNALAVLPRWRWVGAAAVIPGILPIASRVYTEVAARRSRDVCADGACAVHTRRS